MRRRGVFAVERRRGADVRRVAANFSADPVEGVLADDGWVVAVGTERHREGAPWDGRLDPESAVVLERSA